MSKRLRLLRAFAVIFLRGFCFYSGSGFLLQREVETCGAHASFREDFAAILLRVRWWLSLAALLDFGVSLDVPL